MPRLSETSKPSGKEPFSISKWIYEWVRDFIEVGLTVGVILLILRVVLGAHMLVPLVVVTSGSMVHDAGDNSWFVWMGERDIPVDEIAGFPLNNGFNMGDMIVVISPNAKLGDVIIYERDRLHSQGLMLEPIIHRAVGVVYVENWSVAKTTGTLDCYTIDDFNNYHIQVVKNCSMDMNSCPYPVIPESNSFRFYITKGDHNKAGDQCSNQGSIALPVNEAQVTARGWIRLPYIGYLKLLLNAILQLILGGLH